jgi:hypothetical protein
MTPFTLPTAYPRIKGVGGFEELVTSRFEDGVNALCWERTLAGDFAEVVERLGPGEGIVTLDEARLRELAVSVSAAGRTAIEAMLEDLQRLREQEREPVLNCIHEYPRDEDAGPVRTDVFSFHVDSAPVEADTWLCTYHGAPSEGLRHEEAVRKVDEPETRAALLKAYAQENGEAPEEQNLDQEQQFREWLGENRYDLHYAPLPRAQPFSFGVGNLWRIAVQWPGSAVPACIHRAPDEDSRSGGARLLLIS